MKFHPIALVAVGMSALFLSAMTAPAEVKVTVERHQGEQATAEFKFKGIPAPAKDDAGTKAEFTIIDGQQDENGGDVAVLHDGKLPTEEDQPAANFFFNAGTEGGRLRIDLGSAMAVRQINTYSWHPNTRGPQVYKLYAATGTEKDFNAKPTKDIDPAKCGWTLVHDVDTRTKDGEPGGQYGVSISDTAGPLGTYRYFLLAAVRTEEDDAFGNTFFSEIDIIADAAAEKPAVPEKPAGEGKTGAAAAKYNITIDTTETPDLKEWADGKLRPVVDEWYPKIVQMLPSDGYTAPQAASITFRKDKKGVADTGGTRVNCAGDWFKKNLNGEARGAVVHELVHVVQQYRNARGGNRNPGWLVEGVADYIRWFIYEPESARPHPNPDRAKYDDSYRTTAHFLNYVSEKYDKDLVRKLNAAMREGKYKEELWKEITGKPIDELGTEWKATLKKR